MKALHDFICQKHHNNRKAPGLQADMKMPVNTTPGRASSPVPQLSAPVESVGRGLGRERAASSGPGFAEGL